jgi:uncharacterized protein YfcZ (UPF0381/DUF406 family)
MQKRSKMHEWPGSALAREHSKCIERVLNRVGRVIADRQGRTPAFERRHVKQTARNTYDIEYLMRDDGKSQLSLRFIVTGENADLVLFQIREKPKQADSKEYPGEIDQHVYRVEEMDHLKEVVEDKVVSHLLSRTFARAAVLHS